MNVSQPKADDFRVDLRGSELVVTFSPTGALFVFDAQAAATGAGPKEVRPGADSAYSDGDVRRIAIEIADVARRSLDDGTGDL